MFDILLLILSLADFALTVLTWLIIISAVLSWIRPDPYHPAVRLLDRVVQPILRPIQNIMPNLGGIDISPIVAIILIQVIQSVVIRRIEMTLLYG